MSEADTPIDHQDLPALIALNPFSAVDISADGSDSKDLEAPVEAFDVSATNGPMSQSEDVSEIDLTTLPEIESLAFLVQELHQHNTDLLGRVTQLESILNDCQNTIHLQSAQTQNYEVLLAQKEQELSVTETHVKRLMSELENSHQTAQRQQVLIETVTAQLQTSQEHIARLERECALAQQGYEEQAQLLLQTETTCCELQSRLHHQQRCTQQFKAALEKSLKKLALIEKLSPEMSELTAIDNPQSSNSETARPQILLPAIQLVSPWTGNELGSPTPLDHSLETVAHVLSDVPLEVMESSLLQSCSAAPDADETISESHSSSELLPLPDPVSPVAENPFFAEDLEADLWQDLAQVIDASADIVSVQLSGQPLVTEATDSATLAEDSTRTFNLAEAYALNPEFLTVDAAGQPTPETIGDTGFDEDLSASTTEFDLCPSWPSPVVYPQRQKKLKSLAAIELPNFPRLASHP